jgi:hypothetical protein
MYVESRICNYSLLSRLRNMQGEQMFAARVVIAISRMCFLIKTKVVVIQGEVLRVCDQVQSPKLMDQYGKQR